MICPRAQKSTGGGIAPPAAAFLCVWARSPSVIRLEPFVDRPSAALKQQRKAFFNLQCKYLRLGRRGDNGAVFQTLVFVLLLLESGKSFPLFFNCEARRLVRVLPTFHPRQRSHQICCLVTPAFTPTNPNWFCCLPEENVQLFFFFSPLPNKMFLPG